MLSHAPCTEKNNNSEECKSHSGHVQVHAQNVSTMGPPPWHATPDGQWHARRHRPAPPTSETAVYYWRGTFRSWLFTTEGFPHPTDRMCLFMLRPIFTQSCGKEPPCGKSPSHTRVGSQALLDRVTVFAGLLNSTCDQFSELHFGLPTTVNSFASHLRAGSHRMLWIT